MPLPKAENHGTAVEGIGTLPTSCSVIFALADDIIFQNTQNMVDEKRCHRSDIPYGEHTIKGQAGYFKEHMCRRLPGKI